MSSYWGATLSWMDLNETGWAALNLLFHPVKETPMGIYLSGDLLGDMVEAP